jgi:Type II secretion system (T2SS), protein E, N-terminal domain
MKHTPDKIVQLFTASLVKHQAITPEQSKGFQEAYATNIDALIDLLLSDGIITRRDVLIALSETYQVPWFDVTGYFFDHQLVHLFPKGFMLRAGVIPLMIDEDELIVVAAQPSDDLLPQFGEYVSWDIQFQVGIRRHIEDAVKEFYDESIASDIAEDVDFEQERRIQRDEAVIEEEDIEKLDDLEE